MSALTQWPTLVVTTRIALIRNANTLISLASRQQISPHFAPFTKSSWRRSRPGPQTASGVIVAGASRWWGASLCGSRYSVLLFSLLPFWARPQSSLATHLQSS